MTRATIAPVVVGALLRDVRCAQCGRLLLRATAAPLRAGARLELKCSKSRCAAVQFLIGTDGPRAAESDSGEGG